MAKRRLMTVECHWPIGVRQANLNPWSAGAWGKPGDVERWQRQGPRPRLACLSPAGVTQRDARNLYGDLSKTRRTHLARALPQRDSSRRRERTRCWGRPL